ncbi:hypothetical protein [Maribacter sp. 2-571]|uniref:hypothetical protein n=1 Tax=Maribacter sp. 2-571 TaxID=3417569 RepID=UPI003D3344F3
MKIKNHLRKNTKRLLLLVSSCYICFACGPSKTAVAAEETTSEKTTVTKSDRKDARMQLMADLALREDQQLPVREILKERQERIQEIRNSGGNDRRAQFQQMRTVSQETDSKLALILDESQLRTYEAFKQEQREQMRGQMQNRRGGRGGF